MKLTVACSDVVILVEVTIVLNVNSEVRFDTDFVIRFDVSNSAIIVDRFFKPDIDDNVILINKAFIDSLTFIIDSVFILLFLMTFFYLWAEVDCRLRCMTLLLEWSNLLFSV